MDVNDIRSFLKYTANERSAIEHFNLPSEAFLPMLLSFRGGGSWSYSTEELTTISVKNVTTTYDEKERSGHTHEEIYLFINPSITHQEGVVHRLEKCSRKGERVIVTRPYRLTIEAERIILAQVDPEIKKINIDELDKKKITLTGSPAYSAAHEMEHLKKGEIEGLPLWNFEFVY